MALAEDIALLSLVPLFCGLSHDDLRLIAFGAERCAVAAGQTLFRERSPAEYACVVVRGQFQLSTLDRNGQSRPLGNVGRGAMLSELALATMAEHKFTATAIEDAEVLRITRSLFHRLLEEYPAIGRTVESRLKDSLAEMTASLTALSDRFACPCLPDRPR